MINDLHTAIEKEVEAVLRTVRTRSNTYGEALKFVDELYDGARGDKVKMLIALEAKEVLEKEMFAVPIKKEAADGTTANMSIKAERINLGKASFVFEQTQSSGINF